MDRFIHNELLVIITNYACSLKCKDCANYIYKIPTDIKKQFVDPEQLKKDLEKLSSVLRTNRIQIQGGESTLHKQLDEIIDIVSNSGISSNIQLITNATSEIEEKLIASIKKNKVSVRISNYEARNQRVENWEAVLQKNSIDYLLYKFSGGDDLWYDLGDYQMQRRENNLETKKIYENCPFNVCWTLSEGLLTKCSRSASAYLAKHHDFFDGDFVHVRDKQTDELYAEIENLKQSDYMQACSYCNGTTGKRIPPGTQIIKSKTDLNGNRSKKIKAAFYYSLAFQLRVLEPIASEFEDTFFSTSIDKIEEWMPDVLFTAEAGAIHDLRKICDTHDILLIGLRHGVANKYIPTDPEYSLTDYVCGSRWDKNDFESAKVFPRKKFLITGNPWVDGVFRIPKVKLNKVNPTILFAPTYNPEVSAAVFFKNDLVELIRSVYPDSKIIIKPHPAIIEYDFPFIAPYKNLFMALLNYWRTAADKDPNVQLIEDSKVSISDFYAETDILISDGSSLVFEFMALNRPILLYTSDDKVEFWSHKYDENSISNARRNVGTEFKTKPEFISVLKNAFKLHSEVHSFYQKEYSDEIFGSFTDGNSFKRVANAVKFEFNHLPVSDTRLMALYIPAYKSVKEEDKKFEVISTEGINILETKPLFPDHYQPHQPVNYASLNSRLDNVYQDEIDLAKENGIYGFCYYYYWSNNKPVSNTLTNNFLENKELDFPFCLCLTNQEWLRQYEDHTEKNVLNKKHKIENDLQLIRNLLPFLHDDRYIRIDNKPVVILQQIELLSDLKQISDKWRNESKRAGFEDLYLIFTAKSTGSVNPANIGFDAVVELIPDWAAAGSTKDVSGILPEELSNLKIYDYKSVMNNLLSREETDYKSFRCVSPSWDNTPLQNENATILVNSSPEHYKEWLAKSIQLSSLKLKQEENIVFVNSWNDWTNGNHLEPDVKNGKRYLVATLEALTEKKSYTITKPEIIQNREVENPEIKKLNELLSEVRKAIDDSNLFEAYLSLEKASKINSEHPLVVKLKELLSEQATNLKTKKKWNSKKSAETLVRAEKFIEQKNLDKAKTKLLEVLNLEPEHVEALNDYSVINVLEDNLEYATELIKVILKIEPENELAIGNWNYIRQARVERGELEESIPKLPGDETNVSNGDQDSNSTAENEIEEVKIRHNDYRYTTPRELTLTPTKDLNILVISSCLFSGISGFINTQEGFSADYLLFNNAGSLPAKTPHPIDEYNFQLIQIPLRSIIPEMMYYRLKYENVEEFENLFKAATERLAQLVQAGLKYNIEHGVLTFVTNFLAPQRSMFGKLLPRYDLRNHVYFVEKLNEQLCQILSRYKNCYLFDIDQLSSIYGRKFLQDDHVWSFNHAAALSDAEHELDQNRISPLSPVSEHYNLQTYSFVRTIFEESLAMYRIVRQHDQVKIVIMDLDDTLWRGVIAESDKITGQEVEGWPIALAEALLVLKNRGILLAIASKNDEGRIKQLWDKIFSGRFLFDDFAIKRINWKPKPVNIAEILAAANLLPKNAVFIDDNPVERKAVQMAFPEIRVLGEDPYYLRRILLWSSETQVPFITEESSNRTNLIKAQQERNDLKNTLSREEFLQSLNIHVRPIKINNDEHVNFRRSFELINKTNQFNTTGKRWTEVECNQHFASGGEFYSFDVEDAYSKYGLVAVIIVKQNIIQQFVMSCRVVGLDVEFAALSIVLSEQFANGYNVIFAETKITEANLLSRDIFNQIGFTEKDSGSGVWQFNNETKLTPPSHIQIIK